MKNRTRMGRNDRAKFVAAMITLFLGLALVFIGCFLPPLGAIDASIEIVFGEILGFVGAVWGIDTSYASKNKELEYRYRKHFPEIDEANGDEAEGE